MNPCQDHNYARQSSITVQGLGLLALLSLAFIGDFNNFPPGNVNSAGSNINVVLTGGIDTSGNMDLSWTPAGTTYQVQRENLATGVWTTLGTGSGSYPDTTYDASGYHYHILGTDGSTVISNEFPASRYAVIAFDPSLPFPTSINNHGSVLMNPYFGTSYFWAQGNAVPIPLYGIGNLNQRDTVVGLASTAPSANDELGGFMNLNQLACWTATVSPNGQIQGSTTLLPTATSLTNNNLSVFGYGPLPDGTGFGLLGFGGANFDDFGTGIQTVCSPYAGGQLPATFTPPVIDDQNNVYAATYLYYSLVWDTNLSGGKNGLPIYYYAALLKYEPYGDSPVGDYNPSLGSLTPSYQANGVGGNIIYGISGVYGFNADGEFGLIDSPFYYDGTSVNNPSTTSTITINAGGEMIGTIPTSPNYSIVNPTAKSTAVDFTKIYGTPSAWNQSHQILASGPSNSVLFENGTNYGINDLLPASSGWTTATATALNDSGAIVGTATYSGTNLPSGSHGVMLLPVQINAYRPQMVPNSVDLTPTDPTKLIIPQSEVQSSGVHIRVDGDNDVDSSGNFTNFVKVTFSSPAIAAMSNVHVTVQSSGANLWVWPNDQADGSSIAVGGGQGNLTLDANGNATIWVEAQASGGNDLTFLLTSGTTTIGTLGKLHFVNYDSFIEEFSGETFGTPGAAATGSNQGMFNVAQNLYLEGYNIAYYDVHTINSSTSQPALAEISNQTSSGFVTNVGVFGYSHGGGETYNTCNLLAGTSATISFAGYVDAIQFAPPYPTQDILAQTTYPPGAAFMWNYYETNDTFLHSGPVTGANVNLNVNTTAWGANLYHSTRSGHTGIAASPNVQADLQSAVESHVSKY